MRVRRRRARATLDLSAANVALLAGDAADVFAAIELRNRGTGANGSAGAAVYVKNAAVASASLGTAST